MMILVFRVAKLEEYISQFASSLQPAMIDIVRRSSSGKYRLCQVRYLSIPFSSIC